MRMSKAMYFGSYLKKSPSSMSRQEHYAGRDKSIIRYRSYRTKQEESLTLSGDEYMERFTWHVPEKQFRKVLDVVY